MRHVNFAEALYRIYCAGFHFAAIKPDADKAKLREWISEYDDAWFYYKKLIRYEPSIDALEKDGIGALVDELRKKL